MGISVDSSLLSHSWTLKERIAAPLLFLLSSCVGVLDEFGLWHLSFRDLPECSGVTDAMHIWRIYDFNPKMCKHIELGLKRFYQPLCFHPTSSSPCQCFLKRNSFPCFHTQGVGYLSKLWRNRKITFLSPKPLSWPESESLPLVVERSKHRSWICLVLCINCIFVSNILYIFLPPGNSEQHTLEFFCILSSQNAYEVGYIEG